MNFAVKIAKLLPVLLITATLATAHSQSTYPGIVVTENYLATKIGADILQQGGNAIDAAIAVGYALAVVNPCCGNIGGGGFMTIHLANGKNIFINFRETAPERASRTMYINQHGQVNEDQSLQGYLAVAVPGTVMGLETARKQYGTMSRAQLMQPAIDLAKNGFTLTPYAAALLDKFTSEFKRQPNIAQIFMQNNKILPAGQRLTQTNLANTLTLIQKNGVSAFYRGSIAQDIVAASQKNNGILSLKDFANYHVTITKPIQCEYRGYQIISAPPPSSGGITLCETLNILEYFPLNKMGFHSAASTHTIIEALRYSFNDRNTKLGDPDFVNNPTAVLISKKYAKNISKQIKQGTLVNTPHTKPTYELTDTTHYSVLDQYGNGVAVTYTLNGFFGALVMAGDTGFFLNNEMNDFAIKSGVPNKFNLVQNDANDIMPHKRPLSSMTPTIVMKNNRIYMILGSPGGPRIITSVLQTILNLIDYDISPTEAVNAPRIHFQAQPDVVFLETNALPENTISELEKMGYDVEQQSTWSAVEAIILDPSTGQYVGINDVRRPDGAAAPSDH